MSRLTIALIFLPVMAFAQDAPDLQEWRTAIDDVLAQPPATVGAQDLQRLEESLRFAGPYFAAADSASLGINRELIRRIAAYLFQVNLQTRNPRTRFALRRANQALASLRLAVVAPQPAPPVAKPQQPQSFDPRAPVVENVTEADAPTVRELRSRYESAAAQATGAWEAAGTLRASLAVRGMGLNPQMASSALRIQLYLETAADAMRGHEWDDARDNIARAEYETQKLLRTIGR
jgi:hypothetical protein